MPVKQKNVKDILLEVPEDNIEADGYKKPVSRKCLDQKLVVNSKSSKTTKNPSSKSLEKEEKKKLRAQQFDEMGKNIKENKKLEKPLPFHILGFNSQRHILIWHKGKILPMPVQQLTKDNLKLLVGNLSEEKYSKENNEDKEDNQSQEKNQQSVYTNLKNEIITQAYNKGLVDDEEPIKSGIWKFKDDWVIVSGRRAALIQNSTLTFLDAPIINDHVIQFERSTWIDLEHLKNIMEKGNIDLQKTFGKLKTLISQWCWADDNMIEYASAFIMLQLFQSAMSWRPWLYLLGAAHTGKSTFLEYVFERIFGCQVKRLDKSTGYATAQALGGNSKIPIYDEFEKNTHISSVLENLKLSNRGGVITTGTTSDNPKEFSLVHMPWFASIYFPRSFSSDQAQISRVIKFELKKILEGKSVIGLTDIEARDLLCEIVAAVLLKWHEIEKVSRNIELRKGEFINSCKGTISGRTVENFMYAMALIEIIENKPQEIPRWAIHEVKDDGENILESIVMSKIRSGSDEYFVVELINKALGEPISINIEESYAKNLLRKHGLSVVKKTSGWFLAIRPKDVCEHLFKFNTDYKGLDIKAPLERLDGTEKNVKTDWGEQNKLWAMHIPGRHILAISE